MKQHLDMSDRVSFQESTDVKHGLHGHVSVYRRNKTTGETTLWYENDNIIPISGMSWILMKMFGLYLDSRHGVDYEDLGRDTNLVTPDLNTQIDIGVDPNEYIPMAEDISDKHFIQGFMVGNGGSGEDQMTTKNTDYSFVCLRNPIPFRQGQVDNSDGMYLGKYRSLSADAYYIKRFSERPHITHSWWRDGQKWDYVDPVTQDDLGPNAANGTGKTNRIETYAECQMVLDENDCVSFFAQEGNAQTPVINELGLVAFDTTGNSTRELMETIYNSYVKPVLDWAYNDDRHGGTFDEYAKTMASQAVTLMMGVAGVQSQSNIHTLYTTLQTIAEASTMDYQAYKLAFSDASNIEVTAFFKQDGNAYKYAYETDKFMDYLEDPAFDDDTEVEAERIKLITYYTFKAIPIEENWETLINYRIYAN